MMPGRCRRFETLWLLQKKVTTAAHMMQNDAETEEHVPSGGAIDAVDGEDSTSEVRSPASVPWCSTGGSESPDMEWKDKVQETGWQVSPRRLNHESEAQTNGENNILRESKILK